MCFFVGRIGANAVATVGLTESLLSLVFSVAMGLSLSTTAMVARRIGEKDPEGAAVAGVQAIILGLSVSVVLGVPCLIYAPRLLQLMGASPEIVANGSGYARIALGGSGVVLMLFLNNAIFRGAGDARDRDALALGVEHHQPDPRSLSDLRPRPVPAARRDRRRTRDVHGPKHWCGLPVLPAVARDRTSAHLATPDSRELSGSLAPGSRVYHGYPAVFDCPHSWIALVRIVSVFGAAALAGYTICDSDSHFR